MGPSHRGHGKTCTMPGSNGGLCGVILRTIWASSPRGRPVEVAMCPICDYPECTACKRKVSTFHARTCDKCGASLVIPG